MWSPRRCSSSCCRRSCGSATRCSSPGSCSAARSAGSGRRATTTRCRGRRRLRQLWPQTLLGLASIGVLAVTAPVGDSLRAVHRRRAGAVDPARRRDRLPWLGRLSRASAIGRLPEETAPPARAARARAAGDRGGAAAGGLKAMREALRTLRGVLRSLRIYYGDRRRRARDGPALRPVRAAGRSRVRHRRPCRRPHRGVPPARRPRGRGRAAAGARRGRCGCCYAERDKAVAIERVAVGREAGTTTLQAQHRQSDRVDRFGDFIQAADGAPGWHGQAWTRSDRRADDDAR